MKAEDVARLYDDARLDLERRFPGLATNAPSGADLELLKTFARACEQHGVKRAKALAVAEIHEHEDGWSIEIDLSALDAEIAKENEDG